MTNATEKTQSNANFGRKRALGLLALVAMLTACAGQKVVEPLENGVSVRFTAATSPTALPRVTVSATVGKGAARGVGAGAGAGTGLVTSLACGPFIPLCVPTLMAGGAIAGAFTGLAVGSIKGTVDALPKEKADVLDEIVNATFEYRYVSHDLMTQVEQESEELFNVTVSGEQVLVTVDAEAVRLEILEHDHLVLTMDTAMTVEERNGKEATASFNYTGEGHHVDYWIENQGENFRRELQDAYLDQARQMVATLLYGSRIVPVSDIVECRSGLTAIVGDTLCGKPPASSSAPEAQPGDPALPAIHQKQH